MRDVGDEEREGQEHFGGGGLGGRALHRFEPVGPKPVGDGGRFSGVGQRNDDSGTIEPRLSRCSRCATICPGFPECFLRFAIASAPIARTELKRQTREP